MFGLINSTFLLLGAKRSEWLKCKLSCGDLYIQVPQIRPQSTVAIVMYHSIPSLRFEPQTGGGERRSLEFYGTFTMHWVHGVALGDGHAVSPGLNSIYESAVSNLSLIQVRTPFTWMLFCILVTPSSLCYYWCSKLFCCGPWSVFL